MEHTHTYIQQNGTIDVGTRQARVMKKARGLLCPPPYPLLFPPAGFIDSDARCWAAFSLCAFHIGLGACRRDRDTLFSLSLLYIYMLHYRGHTIYRIYAESSFFIYIALFYFDTARTPYGYWIAPGTHTHTCRLFACAGTSQ